MTVPNLKDTITKYRAVYANETGRRRAFLILNAAAWERRETGAGLYYKTGDNSHNERSSDIIIFKGIDEAPAGKGPTSTRSVMPRAWRRQHGAARGTRRAEPPASET